MAEKKSKNALNEKDSLIDMLNTEKTIIKLYSTAITEGVSKGFRSLVQQNWRGTVESQFGVFSHMTRLGYAKVESAPESALSEEKQKYAKVKAQLA